MLVIEKTHKRFAKRQAELDIMGPCRQKQKPVRNLSHNEAWNAQNEIAKELVN